MEVKLSNIQKQMLMFNGCLLIVALLTFKPGEVKVEKCFRISSEMYGEVVRGQEVRIHSKGDFVKGLMTQKEIESYEKMKCR